MRSFPPRLLAVYFFYLLSSIDAATYLCSQQNTGSSFNAIYNMYQSQGACSLTCAGYAFSVLQGFQCWCSNYFPGDQVSTSECDTGCPGYGTDICGGTLNGVYAYYQLAQASGTESASSSTPTSTSSSSSSSSTSTSSTPVAETSSTSTSTTPESTTTAIQSVAVPVTVVVTQTATPTIESTSTASASTSGTSSGTPTVYINSYTSSTHSSSRSQTASRLAQASAAPSPSTSAGLQTDSQQELSAKSQDGFFDSPGKVAGTFVAVGLVVLALVAGLLYFLLRRRKRNRSDSALAGVAGLNRKESSTSTIEDQSALSVGRSRSGSGTGLMGFSGREKRAGRGSPNDINWPIENSEIVPVDQRLNPQPMLMRFDSNYSRHSLRDDEDYSRRVLTVANPEGR